MIYEVHMILPDGTLELVTTRGSFDEADTAASLVMKFQNCSVLIRRIGSVFTQG